MKLLTSNNPLEWVTRFAPLIEPGGPVLDLASGNGRHSYYLNSIGCQVTAIDKNIPNLVQGLNNIEWLEFDLEDGSPWILEGKLFKGIVVTNYLYRPLFPVILNSLDENGVLIYETFCLGNEKLGKPSNPDYLLRSGELLTVFSEDLKVIAYEEDTLGENQKYVKQRICAIKLLPGSTALF